MLSPFFIVGPTAVGKTDMAVEAAARCGAEVVSADAFQIYDGLDRLTAKPSAEDQRKVPHHLIGCVPLSESYNVARYRDDATRCLEEISAKGRPVIVVGGSGLYVKALTHGLSPLPPAQPELRAELETAGLEELLARLRMLDPAAAESIDVCNKRRVVRAVEVCLTTERRFSEQKVAWEKNAGPPASRGVFLTRDKDELIRRIEHRVGESLEEAGLEEVRHAMRFPLSDTTSRIIGLSEVQRLLRGEIDEPTCRERIFTATRRYAKRQMTWFRGESIFETVNLSTNTDFQSAVESIARHVERGTPQDGDFRDN